MCIKPKFSNIFFKIHNKFINVEKNFYFLANFIDIIHILNSEKMLKISKIFILFLVIIISIQNVFTKHQTQINNDLISSSSSSIEENYYLPEINHDFIKSSSSSSFRLKRNRVRNVEIMRHLKKQHNIQHYPDNERFRKMFKIIFG